MASPIATVLHRVSRCKNIRGADRATLCHGLLHQEKRIRPLDGRTRMVSRKRNIVILIGQVRIAAVGFMGVTFVCDGKEILTTRTSIAFIAKHVGCIDTNVVFDHLRSGFQVHKTNVI